MYEKKGHSYKVIKSSLKKILYINFATQGLYESEMVPVSGSKNRLAIFLWTFINGLYESEMVSMSGSKNKSVIFLWTFIN